MQACLISGKSLLEILNDWLNLIQRVITVIFLLENEHACLGKDRSHVQCGPISSANSSAA